MFSFVYGAVDCSIFTDKDERAECERMNIRESMYIPQTTKKKEKRWFIGAEGGLSYVDQNFGAFFAINPLAQISGNMGYSAGGSIGWHNIKQGKNSSRFMFGVRYAHTDNLGKFGTERSNYENLEVGVTNIYGAFDFLFDIHKGTTKIGMILGLSMDFIISSNDYYKEEFFGNKGGMWGLRLGFYIQRNHHMFDFVLSAPIVGVGFGYFNVADTATIGYKFLF